MCPHFQEWLGPGAPGAEEHKTRNSKILRIVIGQNVQNTASPTLMQSALKQIRFTVLHIWVNALSNQLDSGLVFGRPYRWGHCHRRSVCLSVWHVSVPWVAKRLGRSSWFPIHTHGNSNHVLGGVQYSKSFQGHGFQPTKCGRGPPKLAKNVFEDWGAKSRKPCMIRSWCQQMTYRKPPKLYALIFWLGHLWHSVTLKSQRSLWPRTVGHFCPS